jgi:hypothetical protein
MKILFLVRSLAETAMTFSTENYTSHPETMICKLFTVLCNLFSVWLFLGLLDHLQTEKYTG